MTFESLLSPEFVARLGKLEIVARKVLSGEFRGEIRTSRRGPGTLFRDHKNYSQGDDMRFLDWNAYSRLGELLIKQFEAEENLNVSLFLDVSGSMDWGRSNKFGLARQVAAALGYIALNRYAKVYVDTMPLDRLMDRQREFFGIGQVERFLRTLDELGTGGEEDFLEALRSLVGQQRGRGVAVIISDFFSESGYQRGFEFLKHTGYKVAAVHVLDQTEIHPEVSGRLRLIDIESRGSVKGTVSRDLRAAYESEVKKWCDGVARSCTRLGISYARVDSSWPLEKVVTSLLLGGGVLK